MAAVVRVASSTDFYLIWVASAETTYLVGHCPYGLVLWVVLAGWVLDPCCLSGGSPPKHTLHTHYRVRVSTYILAHPA